MAASRGRQQGYDSVCACLLAAGRRCVQLNYGAASCACARMCLLNRQRQRLQERASEGPQISGLRGLRLSDRRLGQTKPDSRFLPSPENICCVLFLILSKDIAYAPPLPKVASVTECAPRARAGAWGHTRSHTPLRAHSAHRVGALEALALEPGRWSSRRRGGDGLHHALHKNIINIHTSRQNCVRSLTTNSRASSLDSSAPHEGRKHERCARVRPRAAAPSPGSIECRQGEVHRKNWRSKPSQLTLAAMETLASPFSDP